ncbi:SIMPL domain-containing protein [Rufibacter roseus]|uniref:SIMPL domain-containing protein n=1 Tax=Rufibacter roseus TaxID=1567108 RepID=A0ABW2DHT6_9BACT|nr:SIMPL domain-containing protein [Rufibacter roseus]
MKTLLSFVAASIFSLATVTAFAQQAPLPPLVSVSGQGEVKVVPDQVTFIVGVEVRERTLEEARKIADQRTSALLSALKKSGIDEKNIQTAYVSFQPIYNGEYGQTTPQFYMATRTISVVLNKIDRYDEVMANLYKAGANRVDGVSYQSSQLSKHQEEARKKAVQNARQKAQTLASEAGAKVGRVYNITEGGTNSPSPVMMKMARESMAMGAGEPTLAAGQIVVSAHVEVSFVLE